MPEIKLGKYQHYKGKYYQVLGMAKHSETLEELVVYQALYDEQALWVRPLKMFLENIELEGKIMPRFKLVKNKKRLPQDLTPLATAIDQGA